MGQIAFVDDSDYEWLNQWKWFARKNRYGFYAGRTMPPEIKNGKRIRRTQHMHRLLLGIDNTNHLQIRVDHVDCNGLNNQRHNIRISTPSQNGANRRKNKGAASRYKGVYFKRKLNKWEVSLQVNKDRKYIGVFEKEEDAARAYNEAAIKHFGDFALLNEVA